MWVCIVKFFFIQLMARPLKLHIIPQETFPTKRPNNCVPQGAPQEVGDMPQMAAFVYEFYIQKVQAMKSAFYVSTWCCWKMLCEMYGDILVLVWHSSWKKLWSDLVSIVVDHVDHILLIPHVFKLSWSIYHVSSVLALGLADAGSITASAAMFSVTIKDCLCRHKLKWMFCCIDREPRKCGRGRVPTRQ